MFAKLGDIYNYLFIITSLFCVFWFLAFDFIHQLFYNILFLHLFTTVMFLWGFCYQFCPIFNSTIYLYLKKKLAFDFCRFCVVIRFFHPCHNGHYDLRLQRIFPPDFYPLHLLFYLCSSERASISLFNVQLNNTVEEAWNELYSKIKSFTVPLPWVYRQLSYFCKLLTLHTFKFSCYQDWTGSQRRFKIS